MNKTIAKSIFQKELEDYQFRVYNSRPDFKIHQVNQVHEAEIATSPCTDELSADGILSQNKNDILAIKTADCLPVAFIGRLGSCLVHAGWRGVAKKILVHEKLKSLQVEEIFIGPCIHACCFEVQEDFKDNFPNSRNFQNTNGQTYFDLVEEASEQMRSFFPNVNVKDSKICTMCDMNFHSYRRDKTQQRNWNILAHKDILNKNEENI